MRSHVQYCSDEHSERWELAVGFAEELMGDLAETCPVELLGVEV